MIIDDVDLVAFKLAKEERNRQTAELPKVEHCYAERLKRIYKQATGLPISLQTAEKILQYAVRAYAEIINDVNTTYGCSKFTDTLAQIPKENWMEISLIFAEAMAKAGTFKQDVLGDDMKQKIEPCFARYMAIEYMFVRLIRCIRDLMEYNVFDIE